MMKSPARRRGALVDPKASRSIITPEGVEAFRAWINTTLDYSRERDRVHLKAAYLEWADPDAARAQMQAHIAYHSSRAEQWREMIATLEDRSNPTLATRLAAAPEKDRAQDRRLQDLHLRGHDRARQRRDPVGPARGCEMIDELES